MVDVYCVCDVRQDDWLKCSAEKLELEKTRRPSLHFSAGCLVSLCLAAKAVPGYSWKHKANAPQLSSVPLLFFHGISLTVRQTKIISISQSFALNHADVTLQSWQMCLPVIRGWWLSRNCISVPEFCPSAVPFLQCRDARDLQFLWQAAALAFFFPLKCTFLEKSLYCVFITFMIL